MTVAVRSGRRPRSRLHGAPDERVVDETAKEGLVVVVDGEHEAELGQRRLGPLTLDPDRERPVRPLMHAGERGAVVGLERHRQDTVPQAARRVAPHPCRERE